MIMVEFKDKINGISHNDNLCEIYPSSINKQRRNAMDLRDGIPSSIREEYTSVKYSDHKYINDEGSTITNE